MKKIKLTDLIISIVIAELTGALSALISGNSWSFYSTLAKPPFSPPGAVFPIVWTILYALMGVSAYMISASDAKERHKKSALKIYGIQLAVNALWSILFFRFRLIGIAAADLSLLVVLVIIMLIRFGRIKPAAAYINIPYLIWTLFALYLNVGVLLLNK